MIHRLNQRYHQEYLRAERNRVDAEIGRRVRRLWLFRLLKRVKHILFSPRSIQHPLGRYGAPFPLEPVELRGRVSIIIPFKDQYELLRECLRSLRHSTYRNHEVILVDNGSTERAVLSLLERLDGRRRYHIVRDPQPFNFSRLCNAGAKQARGEHLLFLNNDTAVLTRDWLERMLEVLLQPTVGIVGASLYFPDGSIQHIGALRRGDRIWEHVDRGLRPEDVPERELLSQVRAVEGVTAACMMIGRELFHEMNGLDERYAVVHNDMDLCCRVRDRGLSVAVTPEARLMHYESLSRGYGE